MQIFISTILLAAYLFLFTFLSTARALPRYFYEGKTITLIAFTAPGEAETFG